MNEINGLNYEALVELEKLQLEQEQIKSEIEETYRQAQEAERNGDTEKAAELYQIIKNLKNKHDEVVSQITANPLNKASNYDYTNNINRIIAMLEGKVDPNNIHPFDNKTSNPDVPNQPLRTPTGN